MFNISTKVAFYIAVIVTTLVSFVYFPKHKYEPGSNVITWDVSGYYWYLPAIFVHHDLKKQAYAPEVRAKYNLSADQSFDHPSGNKVNKYSVGMAVNFLPWFLAAHVVAQPLGYAADGFTWPYQLALQLGSLLWGLLGIWYLRRVLLLWYSDRTVAWVMLAYVLGSNYLNYISIDGAMSHNWLFTWYCLLLWHTHRFYQSPNVRQALWVGSIVGICTLMRPTDIISVFIPLLWGLKGMGSISEKLNFFRKNAGKIGVAALAFLAVAMIQPAYWKYATGDWFVYSYGDQHFSWLKPHFEDYLVGFRSGWLLYTPVMLLSWIGLFTYWRNGQHRIMLLVFALVNTWIVCAWDIWWYGGRAMVQSYPVMALGMAALLEQSWRRQWSAWLMTGLLALFVYYNIWYTHGLHKGGYIYADQMTKAYFYKIVGRWRFPEDVQKLYDTKEAYWDTPENPQVLFQSDFESDTTFVMPPGVPAINGAKSQYVSGSKEFTIPYMVNVSPGQFDWVRATATFRMPDKEWEVWKMPIIVLYFKSGDKTVKENVIRLPRLMNGGETKQICIDARSPNEPFDRAGVHLWRAGGEKIILMDDLKIEGFKND